MTREDLFNKYLKNCEIYSEKDMYLFQANYLITLLKKELKETKSKYNYDDLMDFNYLQTYLSNYMETDKILLLSITIHQLLYLHNN